ncbi:MAG: hypothetical protein M1822_009051 [Bathelium mastoideum]|nr:MAG: hypothetical protein M1822_009051 [Bathelium mastoideum]
MEAKSSDSLRTRKTRIVCVSDTHNSSPKDGGWKLPKGDVLIHAGDLTNQGTLSELQKALTWIEDADFEAKIVIAGNHDITLDQRFYAQHWQFFHNQSPQDAAKCHALLAESPSISYLNHSSAHIRLTGPSGPQTHFSIFGSPYIPSCGRWAFGYNDDAEAARLWADIPQETDITVTHTPPRGLGDKTPELNSFVGCPELRRALGRVRPRLAICGHVHGGRGALRAKWDSTDGETAQEEYIKFDPPTVSKKQQLIDLTGKTGAKLENDGRHQRFVPQSCATPDVSAEGSSLSTDVAAAKRSAVAPINPLPTHCLASMSANAQDSANLSLAQRWDGKGNAQTQELGVGACAGRKETCIVNAAIVATNYGVKPKRFNKPIVVDIDLPVWNDVDC